MSTREPPARRKLHTAGPKEAPRKDTPAKPVSPATADDHPNKPYPAPSKNMEKSHRMTENRKDADGGESES